MKTKKNGQGGEVGPAMYQLCQHNQAQGRDKQGRAGTSRDKQGQAPEGLANSKFHFFNGFSHSAVGRFGEKN